MKLRKSFIAALTAGALLSCTASSMPLSAADNDTYTDPETGVTYNTQDDWLHVEGNQIVDAAGNPVWLTGCNWFGYNVGSQVFDGVWSQNMHDMLTQIADHGFNVLRVPMSTQILLQWKNNEPDDLIKVNTYSNPELTLEGVEGGTCMYSFDIWNYAVKWCRELGLKIFIDIHSAETASAGHQVSLWYTDNYSTEDWIEALSWFAEYYKNDDTIIAIDLKNEPHGTADTIDLMAKWDDSTDPTNWKYAAETAAAAVLEQNPNLLILVEGTEVYPKFEDGADWTSQNIDYSRYPYSYYHHTWWGGNFRGVVDYPIDLGEHQDQLVYSPHDYGPLVYEQTWFYEGFTQDTLMDDVWYDNWFFIHDQGIAPLLMGEWGGFLDEEHDTDGRNRAWMTALRDLMIEHRIHHTFWCFNENSGDTGGLIAGGTNWTEWDEEKYAFVEPSLWQDDAGVFISLDHEIALGANGQSLNDYYGENAGQTAPTVTTTTAEESKGLVGDVNCDGFVGVEDVILLNRYIAEDTAITITTQGMVNADANIDGDVTIEDPAVILRVLAGLNEG